MKRKKDIDVFEEQNESGHYFQMYAHCRGVGCSPQVRRKCWRYALNYIFPRLGEYRVQSLKVDKPGKQCLCRVDIMDAADDVIRTMNQLMNETDIARQIISFRIKKSENAVKIIEATATDAALAKRMLQKFTKNKADANDTVKNSLLHGDSFYWEKDNEMMSTITAMTDMFDIEESTKIKHNERRERDNDKAAGDNAS